MTFSSLAPSTIFCMVLLGCGAGPEEAFDPTDADTAALRELADQWRAAARAGDIHRYMSFLTTDVVMLVPNQPVLTGQEAVRPFVQSFFEEYRISTETWRSDEIAIAGEWAFDRGTYSAEYTRSAASESFQDEGNYLVIARRQPSGSWQYARLMWNVTHSTWPPH